MPSHLSKKRKPSPPSNSNIMNTVESTSRTKKQKCNSAMSFLAFPQEIRDMIYSYVLSTESTTSQASGLQPVTATEAEEIRIMEQEVERANHAFERLARHRSTSALSARTEDKKTLAFNQWELARRKLSLLPRLVNNNIFCINRQVLKEMLKYIHEHITVKVRISERGIRILSPRDVKELDMAQHIHIVYCMAHRHNPLKSSWSSGIGQSLSRRPDIKTFRFEGTGITILQGSSYQQRDDGCWLRLPGSHSYLATWSCEGDLYRKIMLVLGDVPRVLASKDLKISWAGDELFPENIDDEDVKQYRAQVARLTAGLKV